MQVSLDAGEYHIILLPPRAPTPATTAIPAAATRAPLLSRSGLVDCYGTSGKLLAVECADRSLSFFTGRHFNKGKPLRAACVTILNH